MKFEQENIEMEVNKENGNVWIAVSIIIAGLFVVAAVIYTGGNETTSKTTELTEVKNEPPAGIVEIPAVSSEDYMLGDINAPIKIVEYSDIECPFCGVLHNTLHELIDEYPNEIVWVYRHLPFYKKAFTQAVAVECAALQGGNDAYWTMLDRIYEETPGDNMFDLDILEKLAEEQNLNVDEFNQCIESGQFNDKIEKQKHDGLAAGAQGTPFSVVITREGKHIPVSGAQPIDAWKQMVEDVLRTEINGQ